MRTRAIAEVEVIEQQKRVANDEQQGAATAPLTEESTRDLSSDFVLAQAAEPGIARTGPVEVHVAGAIEVCCRLAIEAVAQVEQAGLANLCRDRSLRRESEHA